MKSKVYSDDIEDEEAQLLALHKEFLTKLPDDIKSAAEHTTNNRDELEKSKYAGCYYCLNIFKPIQIWEWIYEGTADEFPMCPRCGIDSVYGDASSYPVNREFLVKMNKYWFDGDGESINESIATYRRENNIADLTLVNSSKGVEIYINDVDLIDLLREYEMPFADNEKPSPEPGGYAPISYEEFLKNAYVTDSDDDLLLYKCSDCGEPGCWPMVVKVKREGDKVIWSNFQQPHRDESSHNYWDYSSFGPFKFDLHQYDGLLSSLHGRQIRN